MVALSTMNAEDIAVTEASLEAMWVKRLFGEFGFEYNKVELWCINQAKHVEVKFQLIRDIVSQGVIAVKVFHAEDNPVNMVTKSMISTKFKDCLNLLDLMALNN